MTNFFQNLMQTEPHSLQYVRESLDVAVADSTDFISLLKEHHDFLEESIDVLMSTDATDEEKQAHLQRFFRLVEMHGRAEQETLYAKLRLNRELEARLEGYAGQDEHDIAFQLEDELLEMGYQTAWNEEIAAKAKVVAGLVKNHIKEEEETMFTIAENDLGETELDALRVDYLRKCRSYLDESKTIPIRGRDLNSTSDIENFRV